ncbi:unnamed protein product [Bemisia tabaci]|uniref:Protein twisted gastrulation n=1 Tax=Bemisia tabaci TaxID=7038 RepID=A0A9P0AAC4_BEMTA|nr:PREDICTED: protein twisted gastrulation-like [Bemisia tabaci]CAH0390063.1 unnamed protein product [Bemisia tabaci]
MIRFISSIIIALGFVIVFFGRSSDSCNEAVCASIVSKCMITQSCKCDMKNCTCCKDCFNCLSYLFSECCSCVDICPKPNSSISVTSHVEDLSESFPSLFQSLVSEPDSQQRWLTFTFPVDFDVSFFRPNFGKDVKYETQNSEQEVYPSKEIITLNCSVAYMSQCMSWNKCKASCQSMGAASYRWFHDGCCECVGEKCLNYGINESRCLQCPLPTDTTGELDYGEETDL